MKTSSWHTILSNILLFCSSAACPQNNYIDSLKNILQTQKADTNKVKLLLQIGFFYTGYYPDTSMAYGQHALELAEQLHFDRGILYAELSLSNALTTSGNYPLAMDFGLKALSLGKKIGTEPLDIILPTSSLAECYYYMGDYTTTLKYDREIVEIVLKNFPDSLGFIYTGIARVFEAMNQPDSALVYGKKSFEQIKRWNYQGWWSAIYPILGKAYARKGIYDSALYYFRTGIPVSIDNNSATDAIDIYNGIARMYKDQGNPDSALWYAKKVLQEKIGKSYPIGLLKAADMLAVIYESKNNADSSLKYLRIAVAIKDSLFNREKTMAFQNIIFKEQEKQKEVDAARLELRNQFIIYSSLAGLIALLVIAGIILKNKRKKQLQTMRNSIADDLHDDIGSALSSISIMNELAKKKSPDALPLLTYIGESTTTIQENMSDIVWAIKSENDRFENVLQRMNQFASDILDAKNIELDFKCDASLGASRLTMQQRKNFYLFFKEVINNAAKYADAKKVAVCIAKKENYIEMNISDDGKGFDTNKIFSGNGMNTLKKRAAELNGDFKITSHINEGTSVQLKFKIT